MKYDIIFLGGGQAGIFGAYEAVENNSSLKVLVVDKGRMLKNRVCPKETLGKCVNCPTCAIIYGVSGAGAFSDSGCWWIRPLFRPSYPLSNLPRISGSKAR